MQPWLDPVGPCTGAMQSDILAANALVGLKPRGVVAFVLGSLAHAQRMVAQGRGRCEGVHKNRRSAGWQAYHRRWIHLWGFEDQPRSTDDEMKEGEPDQAHLQIARRALATAGAQPCVFRGTFQFVTKDGR